MSNEKNSSLFTQLLSDTKYIFITILSYKVLKTFVFTWKNILGVAITTLAGIIITANSIYNNIQIKSREIIPEEANGKNEKEDNNTKNYNKDKEKEEIESIDGLESEINNKNSEIIVQDNNKYNENNN